MAFDSILHWLLVGLKALLSNISLKYTSCTDHVGISVRKYGVSVVRCGD